ncbi:LysR family transcriptional regulator substrate-binding protein [uncultured Slackia sp.]|uniref:LysR family transcriptional regulator substrate-binding protein n=1 Tax=uncultured Slackia sp. TaxID=665903 RepID=UPI0026DFACA8|nr:LysR family transcriptional regulator substrate-binding protein [uncultured Slackia sp.]
MLSLPHHAIARFQRANPDILLSLEEVTTETALDMADEGEADVAIVGSAPCYLQDFDTLLVVKTGIYLYVPKESPLANEDILPLKSLDKQPFITTGKRNHLHRFFIEQCSASGIAPHILFTTSDIPLLVEQAERQKACYFGFPPSIKKTDKEAHVLRPVDIGHEAWFGTYAVKRRGAPLSEAAKAFWSYLSHEVSHDATTL